LNTDPFSREKFSAILRLRLGWEIYLIEDKPYPVPHKTIMIHGKERQDISYNAFASLLSRGVIKPKGTTFIDGKRAEVFNCNDDGSGI
jgi:hypothetical protein